MMLARLVWVMGPTLVRKSDHSCSMLLAGPCDHVGRRRFRWSSYVVCHPERDKEA